MIRTLDAQPFNAIARHPKVRPWLGVPDGDLDVSPMVQNLNNVCLLTPSREGGYVLHKLQAGLYEAHTLALPSGRGKPMLDLMRDGFAYMFLETDAVEIVTRFPEGNLRAERWGEIAGFRKVFYRADCVLFKGSRIGAWWGVLAYQDWVLRDVENKERGEAFHDFLSPYRTETHPHDETHDYWVGATLRACAAGNAVKAIGLYNRWAVQAGYGQARILSLNPLIADIGDAVLELSGGDLKVLKASGVPVLPMKETVSCQLAPA